jgi:hypothetical protein
LILGLGYWMWCLSSCTWRTWWTCSMYSFRFKTNYFRCLWWYVQYYLDLFWKVCFLNVWIGKIKIWDLQAALDPRSQPSSLCIKTITEHTGRVFRLQFDDFQIISSSHDDTILCFNFLQSESSNSNSINSTPILGIGETQVTSFPSVAAVVASSDDQDADEVVETALETQVSVESSN